MTGSTDRVAVVTDSTAYLPEELAQRHHLVVVPLTVVIGDEQGREGLDIAPAEVAQALRNRSPVRTSRPAPHDFIEVYQRLLDEGASGIVSVHLSGKLSGTCDAATLAATSFDGRVEVVDSRSTGMGLGFPASVAAELAASGADLAQVRAAAEAAVGRTSTLFYVDTLEYLRRGGRIGAASALLGTALAVKPILVVRDGVVVLRDKVRTAGRGLARLVDLVEEAAGDSDVDVAVQHLDAPDRAGVLTAAIQSRLGDRLRSRYTTDIGAVVAAHAGPGLVGVVVHRRP